MKSIKRTIRNWLGVNQDSSYPHRFVTIVNWRDQLLGVDGNGDIYEIKFDYTGQYVQLAMRNPLER